MPRPSMPVPRPPWFRRTSRGIGIAPAGAAGWAATGLLIAVLIGGRLWLDASGRGVHGRYVAAMGGVVALYAAIVWRTLERHGDG